jgi:hypothetical protein
VKALSFQSSHPGHLHGELNPFGLVTPGIQDSFHRWTLVGRADEGYVLADDGLLGALKLDGGTAHRNQLSRYGKLVDQNSSIIL